MKSKDVLVTGELNVDILLNGIKKFPVIGEEILADEMTLTLGSSSAIFAANLSSLGIGTSFCGVVGEDLFGSFVLSELNKKKIATGLVKAVATYRTGLTMILNYGQDRANITHCGAMEHFSVQDIPLDTLDQFRHLHLSSYFLQKGLQKDIVLLFKAAHEKGLSTSMDIQWDPADKWDFPYEACLPYIDFFLPNEAELLSLTRTEDLPNALRVLDPFANTIVVKRGQKGALAYQKGNYTEASAYVHSQFEDAIGAGDSFNAGFVCSYLRGGSLQDSLLLGNLAGAINTTAPGGTGAFSDVSGFAMKAKQIFNIDTKL